MTEARSVARKARHRLALRKATKDLAKTDRSIEPGTRRVMVHFGDTAPHLYQLTQWFHALCEIDAMLGVLIVTRSPDAALQLRRDPSTPFPVAHAVNHNDLDPIVAAQDPKVALYVNHHRSNFAMLWHPTMLHCYIGHGESDKIGISASNQLKAYDFGFVAGQAAIDRVSRRLINYDTSQRLIVVGRPQTDALPARADTPVDAPRTVLYAPSWEGDRPANYYGSLRSHGPVIVAALLADGGYRVIFRPHPLTGKRDPQYAAARDQVAKMIATSLEKDPGAGHVVDLDSDFGWQLAECDLCVADVSAVALDAVAAGKPVVITEPAAASANVPSDSVMSRFDLLPASEAARVVEWLENAQTGEQAEVISQVRTYCFGDTSNGASTKRFVEQTSRLADLRDSMLAQRDARA